MPDGAHQVGIRAVGADPAAAGRQVGGDDLPDGRVEFAAEGELAELEAFLQAIRESDVGRFIRHEELSWTDAAGQFRGFEIAP